jgi:hypothetical protein
MRVVSFCLALFFLTIVRAADGSTWESIRSLADTIRAEARAAPARAAGGFPPADLAPSRLRLESMLTRAVEAYGVPRASVSGQVASDTFWAALEETSARFREQLQPRLVALLEAGLADGPRVAQFVDGLAIEQGRKQSYGTVVIRRADGLHFAPIDDPAGLDLRRQRAGLLPMTQYRQALQALHGQPVHGLTDNRTSPSPSH